MNSLERVKRAFNFEEPDRVPIDAGAFWVTTMSITNHNQLLDMFGVQRSTITRDVGAQTAMIDEILLKAFGADFRPLRQRPPVSWKLEIHEDSNSYYFYDEYGIKSAMPKINGYYYDMVEHPLAQASIEDVYSYKGPDFKDKSRVYKMKDEAQFLSKYTDYAITGDFGGPGIFETAWFLRGFEQFLVDLKQDEKFACALLDKVLEMLKEQYDLFLIEIGKYIHVVPVGDDMGSQYGPIISPELYRKLIKPRHAEWIKFVKERTDARVFFHICGSMKWILPDLIEIGVDIVNPVQVDAVDMDTSELKKEYGNKVIFWGGGCDTHRILNRGNSKDIEEEVKRRIKDLAPGGGYVFNQVHDIQVGTPPKNIMDMYIFAQKYGRYPLNI